MTMGFALMLVTGQVATATAAAPPLVVPTDWTAMPPLPWRSEPGLSPPLVTFVEDEVRAGRCAAPAGNAIEVALAIYIRPDGQVRAVVPRAIDCPTVEQFAAGLVTSFARNNLRQPAAGWYRAAITFEWSK
jgi:hypothetical protein